ncbi:NUDIX domain-containing protein [Propioniciclava sp.]|uniref:NUDIX hydrolase n=1 Tax=Propioniciclava sp. TaxID=2038686 RepID=UPI002624D1D7|nr:NUDIX domain-containing protein [Propioniciclava sp.]
MATPDFILDLRRRVGTMPLWLSGATACVHRDTPEGPAWLLARRADNGAWSPVTGIIDPGEHPGDAALREVAEETGIVAEVERLVWVDVSELVTYANGDQTQYINFTFRCRYVSGDPHPADGENVEVAFFPADGLPPMDGRNAAALAAVIADAPECGLGPLPHP